MNVDIIKKRLKILSELQEELNKAKSVLDEKLEDDPSYQKFQDEQAKVREEAKEKKDKILRTQTIKAMDEEVKKLRTDIKENKEILSMELADYYKDNGILEISDEDGNVKRIVFSAKLVNF